ncbi:shikimate kinase [Flavobacteriaceae bacterium MAR_2010_72]|nr:shikimate kinase [Flavobacteriaceae bacterium MAR_2010_72]TVZ60067.1 shikimate kinase [Flavobacteriaceae bacterium MAR_2010_105]
MNIVLIGYMGSGKSSIGKKLASILKCSYNDLDDIIEAKEQLSVTEIFKNKDEIYFRKTESKCLVEALNLNSSSVLSLGGGTPCYGNNMDIIMNAPGTVSIYLKASIGSLSSRLFKEKSSRPLIAHLDNLEALNEFIGKHLFERSVYYNQCDITINSDNKTIDEVVESIFLQLF